MNPKPGPNGLQGPACGGTLFSGPDHITVLT